MKSVAHSLWLLLICSVSSLADVRSQQGNFTPLDVNASLDFAINVDKFIFFRVGAGAFPTASGTVSTVNLVGSYQIPSAPTTASDGNNKAVNWNGSAPIFSSTTATLPVEVRSNAGQVTLRASINSALSSGTDSLVFSDIQITSSTANLPAPPVPASGTGSAVNVVGTAFGGLVTVRSANWTFAYTATNPTAGFYTGQLLFTASAP